MNIKDQVAIVTGAASGIGAAVVTALRDKGAVVACIDLKWETKPTELAWQIDVTREGARKMVFDSIVEHYGVPTIVVPCAGVAINGRTINKDNSLYPIENWQKQIDLNLTAPYYWFAEMISRVAAKYGKVTEPKAIGIAIGSVISKGNGGQTAYAATKSAFQGLIPSLIADGAVFGCRFGLIHPGFCDTPMVRAIPEDFIKKHILSKTYTGKLIPPSDIAREIIHMLENNCHPWEVWKTNGWSAEGIS